jgi:hypothetical protein
MVLCAVGAASAADGVLAFDGYSSPDQLSSKLRFKCFGRSVAFEYSQFRRQASARPTGRDIGVVFGTLTIEGRALKQCDESTAGSAMQRYAWLSEVTPLCTSREVSILFKAMPKLEWLSYVNGTAQARPDLKSVSFKVGENGQLRIGET